MHELLFLFLFTHFAADFLFQTNRMIELKKNKKHKGLGLHILVHFLLTSVGAILFIFLTQGGMILISQISITIVLVLISHYLMDWLKEYLLSQERSVTYSATLFLLDQVLHVFFIILFFNVTGLLSIPWSEYFEISMTFLFDGVEVSNLSKLLLIGIFLILGTEGAGYLLGILLRNLGPNPTLHKDMYSITDEKTEIKSSFNEKGEEVNEVTTIRTEQFYKDSPQKIGRYIGMIERVLIIVFIVQGIPHGMTFLIAVKSLTRFKQFESKDFAEYYLIGSLLSAGIAILLGYAVVRVI
ncbi:DUF3307 domain-containing protein [Pseudalkalibacillus sp. SCS-8]|uniref:DUF3307 domain-containing protein n=1 Tax=Pseudalkalibacillus nanhaiensis TaxID=3115291 RepID=UPI0032DBA9F8